MKTINNVKANIVRCATLLGISAFVIGAAGITPAKADGLNISIGIGNGRVVGGAVVVAPCVPACVVYAPPVVYRHADFRYDHGRRGRDCR